MSVEFFIDDVAVNSQVIDAGTVEQALQTVQSDLTPPDKLIVAFKCDGKEVLGETMAETLSTPVASLRRLEVFTSTKEALVIEAMNQATASLDDAEAECHRIAGLLTEGRTTDGIGALGQCLTVWQQIHDAVSKSVCMLEVDLDAALAEGDRLADLIAKPRDVLVQIKQALQAKDHVLLADILEYEFQDVTQQWHAVVDVVRQHAREGTGRTQ